MKFKKAFAWILAVAMIISLMPSMAFAASTNTVAATPTVATETKMPPTSIKIEAKEAWASKAQTIKLTFNNAEWTTKPAKNATNVLELADGTAVLEVSGAEFTELVGVSDNSVEFTLVDPTASTTTKPAVTLAFADKALTAGSEEGAVEVAIDGLDSYITSSTLTIATAGSSNTVASVTGDVKTYGRVAKHAIDSSIEIRETAVNSIDQAQVLKLTLPKGVTWDDIKLSGNLLDTTNYIADGSAYKAFVTEVRTNASDVNSEGEYYLGNGGRSAYIYVAVDPDTTTREVLNITGNITISKNATEGDITVDVTSYWVANGGAAVSEASELVIAVYGEESVVVSTVDEEDIPTIYAGYLTTNKGKSNWIQINIKETVKDSLQSGRYIDVTLPEEVQVVTATGIKATTAKNASTKNIGGYDYIDGTHGSAVNLIEWESDLDKSEFTLIVPDNSDWNKWSDHVANTWSIFVPVTVQANYAGDIEATLVGPKAGIEDTTLVVANAVSPVTVETSVTEVKNGIQEQALADITITENEIGYIKAGTVLSIAIDNLGLNNSLVIDDAKVEVTDGDMEIGSKITIKDGVLYITVKEASTKVSTISVTELTATLNRTLPEGGYDLLIGNVNYSAVTGNNGFALIDNQARNDGDFSVTPVKVEGYITITTPAEGGVYNSVNADFVIGETSFTVNGETQEMDAAAYIDANNRTMVPIRYFAMACGIDENSIAWDQASQTATITTPARVVKITMGQDTIWVSDGSNIQMDTVAVNEGSRIYVPARFLANALGYEVEWDAATQTVSIY